MKKKDNLNFYPVVLDPSGAIRGRLAKLHEKTRIQKQKLAAEIMAAGLDVIEHRIAKVEA